LEAEIKTGCQAGRLYGESLSLALAAYVSGRYAVAETKIQPPKAGLSPRQLKRVLDYIHIHLQRDLGLGELAGIAPLSPHRFCTLFGKSMGLTPHQYVIRQRIGEAKRLLATRRMSIAEVAVTLGFANQGHFTEVFRKVTGITPRQYQQER
jgi:AraC family transcriptional regulator